MPEKASPEDVRRRVYAAWYRNTRAAEKPTPDNFELISMDGRNYAVLFSGIETLAVYRVRATGQLKMMVRPPKQFRYSR